MPSLHDELRAETGEYTCKVCAYIDTLSAGEQDAWFKELASPVKVVGNTAVVNALKRRGVTVTETSVRRHRSRHGK